MLNVKIFNSTTRKVQIHINISLFDNCLNNWYCYKFEYQIMFLTNVGLKLYYGSYGYSDSSDRIFSSLKKTV